MPTPTQQRRRPGVPYPDAGLGRCRYCPDPCPGRRWHERCRDEWRLHNDPDVYRPACFVRDDWTCAYCGIRHAPPDAETLLARLDGALRSTGGAWARVDEGLLDALADVPLQADHAQSVADWGANLLANYATACAACNRGKGARSTRARDRAHDHTGGMPMTATSPRARSRARTTSRPPAPRARSDRARTTVNPDRARDNGRARALLLALTGSGLIVYGFGVAYGHGRLAAALWALAACTLPAAAAVASRRAAARSAVAAAKARKTGALDGSLGAALHIPPSEPAVKVARWEPVGGSPAPVVFSFSWSSRVFNAHDPRKRAGIEHVAAASTGLTLIFDWRYDEATCWAYEKSHAPARVVKAAAEASSAAVAQAEQDTAEDRRRAAIARLAAGVGAVLGGEVAVTVLDWDEEKPRRVRIGYAADAPVHDPAKREDAEDKIESLFAGRWVAEWDTRNDTVLAADIPDPLADPIPALPVPAALDLAAPQHVGTREDGAPFAVRLLYTHLLLAGATGAGKGSVQWGLVRAVAPGIRDGLVEQVGIDPKRTELAKGRGLFSTYTADPEEAADILEALVARMHARADAMAAKGLRKHVPTVDEPWIIVHIDELAYLTAYVTDRRLQQRIEKALGTLLSQGRALAITLVGALQDPRKDVIKFRDLFPTRIALRLNERTQAPMTLGDGALAAGARPHRIAGEGMEGVGYMMLDGATTAVRFRAAFPTDRDIDEMVTRFSPRQPPRPSGPVAAEPAEPLPGTEVEERPAPPRRSGRSRGGKVAAARRRAAAVEATDGPDEDDE